MPTSLMEYFHAKHLLLCYLIIHTQVFIRVWSSNRTPQVQYYMLLHTIILCYVVESCWCLSVEQLRTLALELLGRQPAAGDGLEPPNPPPDDENVPDWCKCGHCVTMPTQEENKCCTRSRQECITTKTLFPQIVLDANILDIAVRYREDMLVLENTRNNENFCHAAYRQFVLWQHGLAI